MFEQPTSRLNVQALIRDMIEDEQALLTTLGQDFLTQRLGEVETRIKRWQRYLENHYADGDLPPRGDAGRLHTYQIEQALITRLIAESQTEAFPIVYQRALNQARQQVRLLINKRDFTNSALRSARFEARLEQELLLELWSKWHTWLGR
jgi:hypothetical protein